MNKKLYIWVLAATIATALIVVYSLCDPTACRFMPRCIVHTLTGWDCPGCGAQRMAYALLHGHVRAAFDANPFLFCSLPFLLLLIIGYYMPTRLPRLHRLVTHPVTLYTYALLLILWGIGRNLM